MDEGPSNLHWLQVAERTIARGGNFLLKVFTKPEKVLTGQDCMQLKDTYGIRPQDIIKLAFSHGFEVDNIEFSRLLDEDDERSKKIRPL